MSNADVDIKELVHFWQVTHDEYGALLGTTVLVIIEKTIKSLKRLDDIECKAKVQNV